MDVLEVIQVWGDLRLSVQHFRPSMVEAVTVGEQTGWNPPHFYVPGDAHTLFHRDEQNRWVARFDRHWEACIVSDDTTTLDPGPSILEVPVVPGEVLYLERDGLCFVARVVDRAPPVPRDNQKDWGFLSMLSVVACLGLSFGTVMWFSPDPPESEIVELPESTVSALLHRVEEPKPDKPKKIATAKKKGGKAKKKPLKAGKRDGNMKRAKAGGLSDKEKLVASVDNLGILKALNDDQIFGTTGLHPGLGDTLGSDPLAAAGFEFGRGGLAKRGTYLHGGGGGEYEGIGGPGTHGIGGGDHEYGTADLCPPGEECKRPGTGISISSPEPTVVGCLSRATIDEHVKRYLPAVKHCYQKELQRNPKINGKVVTRFVIASDGTVSKSETRTSTVGNSAVDSCVAKQFFRMQFPECRGGIAVVSYPFLFSPG